MCGADFDLVDHGIKDEQLIVAHGSDIISWKESDGQPLVHQLKSWIMNIAAPRCKLAMDNLIRNLAPKLMTIKTTASLLQRNWPAFVEIEVTSKSTPRKKIPLPEKSKINPIFHLPRSAKKLDGEELRTILLNGNEVIPSNFMAIKVEKSKKWWKANMRYVPIYLRQGLVVLSLTSGTFLLL